MISDTMMGGPGRPMTIDEDDSSGYVGTAGSAGGKPGQVKIALRSAESIADELLAVVQEINAIADDLLGPMPETKENSPELDASDKMGCLGDLARAQELSMRRIVYLGSAVKRLKAL